MSKAITLLAALLLLAGWGSAQTRITTMDDVGRRNLPAQRIGVDDLIAISVYRSPELTRTERVDSDGFIHLPLLRDPVRAQGLMPNDLETDIAEALKREGFLVHPIVEVTIAEYASRPISVMGAVNKPLTFQAVGRVTLLDALARAEGLAPDATEHLLVTLPDEGPGGETLTRRIPVESLIDEADPALNLVLDGGEEIRVPEAGRIFVVGNVNHPGAFPMPDPDEASVLRLIAMAEGLSPYARKHAYIYREEPDTGVKSEIEIELSKILNRKSPDVSLQIDDILYIPDNRKKRTAMKALDRAITFGAGTASGMLIWRR